MEAKAALERLQIDLVDFAKNPSQVGEATFHYVLSILDVFTKYLWLYPLENKRCATVATHLKAHFFDWGAPKVSGLCRNTYYSLTQNNITHNI